MGGYSGTLLEGCSDMRGDANEDAVVLSNKSFCVEWGALYGSRSGHTNTIFLCYLSHNQRGPKWGHGLSQFLVFFKVKANQ